MEPNPAEDLKFLALFHADPIVAEKKYLDLFKRLRRFFEWKGCAAPEDLAQETLKRGFLRIQSGQDVYCDDPASYFLGIARLVLLEWWKRRKEEQFDPANPVETESRDSEATMNEKILLERVLESLSTDDRTFLIAYTFEDKDELVRRLGESINAIRIRAFRIREMLRERFDRTPAREPDANRNKARNASR